MALATASGPGCRLLVGAAGPSAAHDMEAIAEQLESRFGAMAKAAGVGEEA